MKPYNIERVAGRCQKMIKQKPREFALLIKAINKVSPKCVVEIGVLRGGLTSWCVDKIDKVIGIDYKSKGKNILNGDSHNEDTLAKLVEWLDGYEIDVLFIDGDHSYEGVKQDFEMYSPLVREGGLIAFHDILDSPYHKAKDFGIFEFWEEIKGKYTWEEYIKETNTWGGIGVLWK